MRIVFMGTPVFAKRSLERLYSDGYDIVGVFTQPDKPRSRGMKVSYSPVKEVALSYGTPVFQPGSLKDGEAAGTLRGLDCDLIVVVAYGKLLPREILDIPASGAINIHASLLPKYRGAAPIQWAIINGEIETGVTSMYISDELDAGDILFTKKTHIGEEETAGELFERLSFIGAELLSETLAAITSGAIVRIPQIESEVTHAPPVKKEMSPIDWTQTAESIKCKVRGFSPKPGASTVLNGVQHKVFRVDVNDNMTAKRPGEIVSAGSRGIEIACADGTVILKELQAPGGKRMAAADFLRGHRIIND